MKFSRWTIAFYVGLVFGSGAVLGAYVHHAYTVSAVSASAPRNPEEYRRRYLAEMKSRLKLGDPEMTKITAILDETRSRFKQTRDSIEPELQRIREEQQAKVRALLSPDQQIEYDKMRKEREERQRQQGNPPPPR